MEHNTAKLKAEAEKGILQVMEEEEALRTEVHEKKRRYLLTEKNRLGNELLDLQVRKTSFSSFFFVVPTIIAEKWLIARNLHIS